MGAQQRRTEEEENAILMRLEREYHAEEASRKDAMDDAMAMHDHVMSDEDVLAELNALESNLHEEEKMHQLRAKQETMMDSEKQRSSVDAELEQSLRKEKEEFEKYEALLKIKKRDEKNDKKLEREANAAEKAHQEFQDTIAKNMHEHMHGNDENAVIEAERNIQAIHDEEMKLQEEYRQQKMEREQNEHDEYMRQKELEQKTIDLLLGRN